MDGAESGKMENVYQIFLMRKLGFQQVKLQRSFELQEELHIPI